MDQTCRLDIAVLCKPILAIVSVVYRPVTVDELVSFVDIPAGASNDESLAEIIGLSVKDFLLVEAAPKTFPSGIDDVHYSIFSRSLRVVSWKLKCNIYGLGAPGFPIDQVTPPDPDPLAAGQYSCVYWIHHLCDYNPSKKVDNDFQDDGLIDAFRR
ncbi:hypothetical protein OIDMADRAFT_58336 [Oidiodendron maius Zn]|uniref:Uncharacterized protein n=1 Tax=Oidiodendron maius (strain Zn) TaxID=913774 RepID=A0A0C3D4B4_OIDMZ|nr:hypothetical protein OIDMADRAFT_58336 [Oidiodendron maius Zn]